MFDLSSMSNISMILPIEYYLGICVVELVLQAISIFGHCFIVVLFYKFEKLRKHSLRLMFILSITDGVFAILSIPQIAYFVRKWDPIKLDYDPLFVVIANIPLTVQLKLNLIITLAIAIDRFQAIRKPTYYRYKNHIFHACMALIFGLGWSLIDVLLEFILTFIETQFKHDIGCVAGGCFTANSFQIYWGFTNMVLGIIGILFTSVVVYEIRKFRIKNQNIQYNSEKNQLQQANRLAMAILTTSLIFTMIPSALVGFSQLIGLSLFKVLGPFYTFCLLCAGVLNFIIDVTLNVQIKRATVACLKGKSDIAIPILLFLQLYMSIRHHNILDYIDKTIFFI